MRQRISVNGAGISAVVGIVVGQRTASVIFSVSLSLELQTDCLHYTCTVPKPENQKLRDANHLLPLVKPLQNKLLL